MTPEEKHEHEHEDEDDEDGGYGSQHLHIVSEDRCGWPGSALTKGTVYLDHSCDEWIIGGRKEVEAMIRDLQALLDKAR